MKRHLKIIQRTKEDAKDSYVFTIKAEYCRSDNGKLDTMTFSQTLKKRDMSAETIEELNNNFANSLRILRHLGGFVRKDTTESEMKVLLNKLTTTDTGIGIRVKNDTLSMFDRFSL